MGTGWCRLAHLCALALKLGRLRASRSRRSVNATVGDPASMPQTRTACPVHPACMLLGTTRRRRKVHRPTRQALVVAEATQRSVAGGATGCRIAAPAWPTIGRCDGVQTTSPRSFPSSHDASSLPIGKLPRCRTFLTRHAKLHAKMADGKGVRASVVEFAAVWQRVNAEVRCSPTTFCS